MSHVSHIRNSKRSISNHTSPICNWKCKICGKMVALAVSVIAQPKINTMRHAVYAMCMSK